MKTLPRFISYSLAGLGVLCILPILALAQYSDAVLADNPAGYWRLNEAPVSEHIAANRGTLGSSADGNYFAVMYGIPGPLAGSPNTATSFGPGTNSYVVVGNPSAFNFSATTGGTTNNFTLEAWAKPNTLSGSVRIFSTRQTPTGGGVGGYGFGFVNTGNLRVTSYGIADINSPAGLFRVGEWVHIAVVRNGSTLQFYTNGVALGGTVNVGNINSTPRPLQLGRNPDCNLGAEAFDGTIAEAAVYNYPLTGAQLLAHYMNATDPSPEISYEDAVLADAPVGYWRLDEPALNLVAINSGSVGEAGNGLYYNSATNLGVIGALSGDTDTAVQLNSSNQKIEVPNNTQFNNPGAFSFEVWANVLGGQGSYRAPITSRDDLPQRGYILYASSANKWEFWTGTGQQVGWHNIVGPAVVVGQWAHCVGTFDGTYKRFYVNGVLVGVGSTVIGPNTARPLRIGAGATDSNPGNFFFNGVIDEAAVYTNSLNQNQVLNHYTIGAGADPALVAPAIVSAPAGSLTVPDGTNLTFTVLSTGSLPLSYQWQVDGSDIPDATNISLALGEVSAAQSGTYTCTITSPGGTVTTNIALVVQAWPPDIAAQPLSQAIYEGGTAQFSVVATGTVHMAYQWYFEGTALPDETNRVLAVPAQADWVGEYFVVVQNSLGEITSQIATLSLLTPSPDTYTALVLADNPVALWRLGEADNTLPAYDLWGGYHGGYSNGVTLNVNGALEGDSDTCASFAGASLQKVEVPYAAALNPPAFTIEAWAKVTGGWGGYRALVSSRDDPPTSGYIIYANDANRWAFWTGTGGGASTWDYLTGPAVATNEWTHIVCTYDGSNKVMYVNGIVVVSTVTNLQPNLRNPFRIAGGRNELPVGDYFFTGDIDEVALYDIALTPARVADHFAAGRLRFNNNPPVANTDEVTMELAPSLVIEAYKLLFNDSDADSDTLSLLGFSATSTNGGSVLYDGATVTYTPVTGFEGTDMFTYTITDGYAGVATGEVVVTVLGTNAFTAKVVYGPVISTDTNFVMRFSGVPGYTYTVEYTDVLPAVAWQKAGDITMPIDDEGFGVGVGQFIEPAIANQRFYRIVYPSY